jgi:hypothetical protein
LREDKASGKLRREIAPGQSLERRTGISSLTSGLIETTIEGGWPTEVLALKGLFAVS